MLGTSVAKIVLTSDSVLHSSHSWQIWAEWITSYENCMLLSLTFKNCCCCNYAVLKFLLFFCALNTTYRWYLVQWTGERKCMLYCDDSILKYNSIDICGVNKRIHMQPNVKVSLISDMCYVVACPRRMFSLTMNWNSFWLRFREVDFRELVGVNDKIRYIPRTLPVAVAGKVFQQPDTLPRTVSAQSPSTYSAVNQHSDVTQSTDAGVSETSVSLSSEVQCTSSSADV